jgi:hypothetical protein
MLTSTIVIEITKGRFMNVAIDYSLVLNTQKDGLVIRDLALCDDNFADYLVQSLLSIRLYRK